MALPSVENMELPFGNGVVYVNKDWQGYSNA